MFVVFDILRIETAYGRMLKHMAVKKTQSRYVSSIAKVGKKKNQQPPANPLKKQATTDFVDKTEAPDLHQLRRTNCGRLWLERGLSVQDIAFCLRMQPNVVLNNIFSYARKVENVDWGRLCTLVKMTPDIAESILQARALAKKKEFNISVSDIMKFCPRKVTSLHIGLVHAMLGRGLSSSEILRKSKAELMDPDNVPTESRVNNEPESTATGSCGRHTEGSLNVAAEDNCSNGLKAAEPSHTDPGLKCEGTFEYIVDCGTRKKIVTEFGLLHWLQRVDGATLSGIAQAFEDCDDIYLMRLIIKMVENSTIIRSQGEFRFQSKNCTGSETDDAHWEDK